VHHLSGDDSAMVNPPMSAVPSMSVMMRRTSGAPQAARFDAQPEHDLIAVDRADIEVDGDARATCGGEPIEQRPSSLSKLVGAERLDAPLGHIRTSSSLHECSPPTRPLWRDGRRKQLHGQCGGTQRLCICRGSGDNAPAHQPASPMGELGG
jgi:hypothetical protein